MKKIKVGLLVNPYAGIGGEAGLKGSDGAVIREKALAYSNELRSIKRVKLFLNMLNDEMPNLAFYVANGAMGADHFQGYEPTIHRRIGAYDTDCSAQDTVDAVRLLQDCEIDLLVFAGGDGTARNVIDGLQPDSDLPCLGIPCGVKMQSGVFALSPTAAAEVIKTLIKTDLTNISRQDVRDIDEEALRAGKVRSKYYGSLMVPAEPCYIQNLKQGGVEVDEWIIDDIAEQLSDLMYEDEGRLILVGPGSTTAHWMEKMCLKNTLVGFDAVINGELVQSDLTSEMIARLQREYPSMLVILSPTGRQGILLGRGNQQLSTRVLSGINKQQIIIVASKSKLKQFDHRPLIVDCNDRELDKKLCGFYPVICGYNDRVLYPVNVNYAPLKQ